MIRDIVLEECATSGQRHTGARSYKILDQERNAAERTLRKQILLASQLARRFEHRPHYSIDLGVQALNSLNSGVHQLDGFHLLSPHQLRLSYRIEPSQFFSHYRWFPLSVGVSLFSRRLKVYGS